MTGLESYAATAMAFLIVTVSPGPANIACASVAMSQGRRVALRFASGLTLGLALWGVFAATGMGALLRTSEMALFVLKLSGACYLFYLAFVNGRAAVRTETAPPRDIGEGRWFWRGVLLNLSNPKAIFAWMAVLAMGLDQSAAVGMVFASTFLCVLIGLANYVGWAWVFSAGGAMAMYRHLRRRIDALVSGLFSLAGIGLLKSAFSR